MQDRAIVRISFIFCILTACSHKSESIWNSRKPSSAHLNCSQVFQNIQDPISRNRAIVLAQDPAHHLSVTQNSLREAEIGLELEASGDLAGPIQRDPTGQAEFLDANHKAWDVKAFRSVDPSGKAFHIEDVLMKLKEMLSGTENLILDRTFLSAKDVQVIDTYLKQNNLNDRVLWYPKLNNIH